MPDNLTDEERAKAEAFFASVPDAPSASAPEGPQENEEDEETESHKVDAAEASAEDEGKEPQERKPRKGKNEQILQALREGDAEKLGDLLDEDPSAWADTTQKAIKQRRALSRVKQERDHAVERAGTIVERWKPVSDLVVAIDQEGRYDRVPELFEMLLGRKWGEVSGNLVRAQRGLPPEVKGPDSEELKELAAADVPTDHKARQLPDWEQGVAAILKDSYDPDVGEPTLSVQQAAARWLRRQKALYSKMTEVWGAPEPKKPTPKLERAAAGGPAPGRKLTEDEFFARYGG